jgi:chemotaxis protein CheD
MTKEIIVGVSSYFVGKNPSKLICIGLGSCVAIALHDGQNHLGALAHAMLPSYHEGRDRTNPGKYVDTSVYLMVDELTELGAKKRFIKAKLVGGAQMFSFLSPDALDVGRRNIESAKLTLKNEGIPIISEDVGGKKGRTMYFDLKTGKVEIRTSGEKTKEI